MRQLHIAVLVGALLGVAQGAIGEKTGVQGGGPARGW